MNLLNPNLLLSIWSIFSLLFFSLVVVTLIKLLIVLFKADRAIDEVREYIKGRS